MIIMLVLQLVLYVRIHSLIDFGDRDVHVLARARLPRYFAVSTTCCEEYDGIS